MEHKLKKNNFLPGLFVGIVSSVLVYLLVFSVFDLKPNKTEGSVIASTSDSSKDTETVSAMTTDIMNKISVLESIIDTYYLGDVDENAMVDGIYKGLLESLDDPYSCYYTAEEYQQLMESSNGIYCGIGATVTQNVNTKVITIVKPFVNGPAYNAGLLPNDIVYKVDGEDVTNNDLSEVVSRMKGEEGTEVKVTVIREGKAEPIELVIKRGKIEVPTIEYKMLENKIGYISVAEFDKVTASQYRSAIEALEKQGMKALVVDVRNNPGGRLETVVDMLDRMLPKGLIVYQEDKNGIRDEEESTNKEKFTKPLAVLINGNSASASEIFAGAIQDYKIGTIVGTTSFGKGIVQSIIPLNDGTAVKVTVSKYFTPNGRNIHGTGITPDIEVDLDSEVANQVVIDYEDDAQLQKAVEVLKDQMKKSK